MGGGNESGRWPRLAGLGIAPLAVAAALAFGFDPAARRAAEPLTHREDGFAGAEACAACHPDQHASWRRTFHRTMTRRPEPENVLGAFDGRRLRYEGREARPFARDGAFFMELPDADGGRREARVALCVGSRRYQQYFERVEQPDGAEIFVRLPFLWHVEARRWLHLNTVFLAPDDPDWSRHRTRWNDNCIFCHNTAPRPGEREPLAGRPNIERRFESAVGDLGIACESCHGPGAQHAAEQRNPLRRYRAILRGSAEPAIVHPERLDAARSAALCGQCHGQRMPRGFEELARWLTDGPTFRSGDLLEDHVRPVRRDTASPDERRPDLFSLRFWNDGTPRLTAYEYQGLSASACHTEGTLSCGSCHTMHGGDPRGMIEPAMRGDDACLPCHAEIGRDVAAHTRHAAASSGSRCMECHMPRAVYGILAIHRSHRIENPDPARDGEAGRPHACTTCHFDRSLVWSARWMREWWGERYRAPGRRADGAPVGLADGTASLLAGDAVQRAVYAWAAGQQHVPSRPRDTAERRALLAVTLADSYPSVRWLARNSLLQLERRHPIGLAGLDGWDHTDRRTRTEFAFGMLDQLRRRAPGRLAPVDSPLLDADFRLRLTEVRALLDRQDARVIRIGE